MPSVILDTTLRDGGLKVKFDWTTEFAQSHLRLCRETQGLDWVEIGYLNAGEKFSSPFYGMTSEFLSMICEGQPSKSACMIDYHYRPSLNHLEQYQFLPELIRITARASDVSDATVFGSELKDRLGTLVSLNLSNISSYSTEDRARFMRQDLSAFDMVYLADTHGGFSCEEDREFLEGFVRMGRDQKFATGGHFHNHRNLAQSNHRVAAESGFDLSDGTLTGLGKGGGNLPTESLISFEDALPLLNNFCSWQEGSASQARAFYFVSSTFSVVDHYSDQAMALGLGLETFANFCRTLRGTVRDEFDAKLIEELSLKL
ncbi:hypothetical protein N8964_00745 [Pontimonas sp.]|nr:hypothetical protein [Pontimonas sp.]